MRVFNLTGEPLAFRRKVIAPDGGSESFPDLDSFIPNRERDLARAGVISFGALPPTWRPPAPPLAPARPVKATIKMADQVKVEDKVAVKTVETLPEPPPVVEEKKPEPAFQSTAEKLRRK